ncbi:MAG: transcriptional regulator [Pseudomonadota bacterium]|nr:transcriptional regulator [Pseudomonadota bacterium]
MTAGLLRFDRFLVDPRDRQLKRDDVPVELSSRYFDALLLLIRDAGQLVSKERFLEEVWRGVPVTDEALTQCIKTLRRQLGDNAANPRFIETVPKHGYRFIAPVLRGAADREGSDRKPASIAAASGRHFMLLGGAGTIGGGFAGLLGGTFYGFAGASQPLEPGIGAASVLLVLVCLTILAGIIGGAGVAFGIAAAEFAPRRRWYSSVVGGAAGGLIVGGGAKLLGLDAFNLLLGQSPGNITGAAEGAVLGGAIGLAAWHAAHGGSLRRCVAQAALASGFAGIVIIVLGGQLMAGSLDQLARRFPASRLRFDAIGNLFGETGLGPVSRLVTGALEGLLFGACLVGAVELARRSLAAPKNYLG